MQSRTLKPRKNYPKHTELAIAPPDPNTSYAHMLEMVGERKKVLDVGCASGFLASLLVKAECDVVGIDINPIAAEEARKYCTSVVVADLDESVMPNLLEARQFDAIIFGDVLEHLHEPARTLDESRGMLSDKGYVVASIPNISHGAIRLALLSGRFDYQELGILDDSHLRFFTSKTIDELFLTAGFRIETIERVTLPLFAPSDLVPVLDPRDFDESALAEIKADPDSETLQFIVKAFPLSNDQRLRTISKRFLTANTELAATKQQIAHRESEVQVLRAAIESHEETVRELRDETRSAQTELETVQLRFKQLEDAYRALEIDSLAKQNAAMERTLAAQAEHARAIESIASLQSKLENVERLQFEARARGDFDGAARESLARLEHESRALSDELEVERGRASAMAEERAALDAQLTTLQTDLAEAAAARDEAGQRLEHERRRAAIRELRVADAEQREKIVEQRAAASIERLEAALRQQNEIRSLAQRERARAERLERSLSDAQTRFEEQIDSERLRSAGLEAASNALQSRIDALDTELGSLQESKSRLEAQLAGERERVAELSRLSHQLQSAAVALRAEAGTLTRDKLQIENKLQEHADRNRRLDGELAGERERVAELRKLAQRLQTSVDAVRAETAAQTKTNLQVEQQLLAQESRNDRLDGELAAERARAADLRATSRRLQADADAMRAQVASLVRGRTELEERAHAERANRAQREAELQAERARTERSQAQTAALRAAIESLDAEVATVSLERTRAQTLLRAERLEVSAKIARTESDCDDLLAEAVATLDILHSQLESERNLAELRRSEDTSNAAELQAQLDAVRKASLADRLVMREYADDFRHRAERFEKEFESAIRQRDDLYLRVVEYDRVGGESAQYVGRLENEIKTLGQALDEQRARAEQIDAALAELTVRSEATVAELTARSEATLAELTARSETTVAELTARSEATIGELTARAGSLENDVAHQATVLEHLRVSADRERARADAAASDLSALSVRHELLQANLAEVDNLLVAQTEQLLAGTSDERNRILTLIDTVQSSHFWRLKNWLARLRARMFGVVREG